MPETGIRAEASKRVRDAIVAATVRIVAREGVAAVTHRRVAAEADVALSSTTWHFATKTDILEAALRWTARREVDRIGAIASRLGDADLDVRLIVAALDGLRMGILNAGEEELDWLRQAVRRQLQALLG